MLERLRSLIRVMLAMAAALASSVALAYGPKTDPGETAALAATSRRAPLPQRPSIRTRVPSATAPDRDLVEAVLLAHDGPAGAAWVAAGMTTDTEYSYVFHSADEGAMWTAAVDEAGERAFPGGDPDFAAIPGGPFYFATLTPRLRLWSSDDGVHWRSLAGESPAVDRHWIVGVTEPEPAVLIVAPGTPLTDDAVCLASGSRWLNGGDTQDVQWIDTSRLAVAWIGRAGGQLELMVSTIDLGGQP